MSPGVWADDKRGPAIRDFVGRVFPRLSARGRSGQLRFTGLLLALIGAACLAYFRTGTPGADARQNSDVPEREVIVPDDSSRVGDVVGVGVPLGGMNEVEIPVQSLGFLQDDEIVAQSSHGGVDGVKTTFDIYFLRPADTGLNRVERIYKGVSVTRATAQEGHVVLSVAEEDVAILLTLAQLGEFRLVRAQRNASTASQGERPLVSRAWVQKLMGDDAVVVVP